MTEENKTLLYNYGTLLYRTATEDLNRTIEVMDNDGETYTLRDVLQTMLNILNSEQ